MPFSKYKSETGLERKEARELPAIIAESKQLGDSPRLTELPPKEVGGLENGSLVYR